jgi:DNA-binding Lrp family transcriptional regulator
MQLLTEFTIAYIMITTETGAALTVAKAVSALSGVRRVVVVTGPYDVMATVQVENNDALGDLVINGIQPIDGVLETMTMIMSKYFKNNEYKLEIDNGPP